MQRINVITPCSRPENLVKMQGSIFKNSAFFDIKWWICEDKSRSEVSFYPDIVLDYPGFVFRRDFNKDSIVGNHQRNVLLNEIMNNKTNQGWCIFIDDDNLVHPKFYWKFYKDLVDTAATYKAYIYSQNRISDLGVILDPKQIGVGYKKTDSSQYVVHTDLIGDTRWKIDDYNADGLFIEDLFKKDPNSFFLSEKILSLRNVLRN